jgi:DNA-binding Lrp family transcriptional regulator
VVGSKLEQKILWLFRDVTSSYSILKISKLLNKSYPHVYHKVQELLGAGIFIKLVVGNTHLCRINLGSDLAKSLLTINEVQARDEWLLSTSKGKGLTAELHKLPEEHQDIIVVKVRNNFYAVADAETILALKKILSRFHIHHLTIPQFADMIVREKSHDQIIVLTGFDAYFSLMRQVQEKSPLIIQ